MTDKYVKDLVAGDTTESYEVLSVARDGDSVVAEVRYVDGGTSTRVWDNPDIILTVKPKATKLPWGISPDREVAIAWGARAIYPRPGDIDLLHDRMEMVGGSDEERKEFGKWLNEYGIPQIRKMTTDEYLMTNEDRQLHHILNDWYITCSPKSSCGYLYIGVFPCDNGNPKFIPAAVPSPKPKKEKKPSVSKARRR